MEMDQMKQMWDSRYSSEEYAYGIQPNEFFRKVIDTLNLQGKILMPAEGEGRNAVYAAKAGLTVTAFDTSNEGRKKALKLAKKEEVKITYEVGEFFSLNLMQEQFDNAALIYAHFPAPILSSYHQQVGNLIKQNGLLILEAFSKSNLKYRENNPGIGGPALPEMLFSKEIIHRDFPNFKIIQLEEVEVELKEGNYHNGTGSVIRFIGKKL